MSVPELATASATELAKASPPLGAFAMAVDVAVAVALPPSCKQSWSDDAKSRAGHTM